MKRVLAVAFIGFALGASVPVFAQQSDDEHGEEDPGKKVQPPDLRDMPSKGKPEPKTCGGRCDRDKGDCEHMCKKVSAASPEGGAQCKKACGDVHKECLEDCKTSGD